MMEEMSSTPSNPVLRLCDSIRLSESAAWFFPSMIQEVNLDSKNVNDECTQPHNKDWNAVANSTIFLLLACLHVRYQWACFYLAIFRYPLPLQPSFLPSITTLYHFPHLSDPLKGPVDPWVTTATQSMQVCIQPVCLWVCLSNVISIRQWVTLTVIITAHENMIQSVITTA